MPQFVRWTESDLERNRLANKAQVAKLICYRLERHADATLAEIEQAVRVMDEACARLRRFDLGERGES